MAIGEPELKRWNRDEYYRLGEAGIFEGQRAELIEGEIYMMSPQGPRHAQAVSLLQYVLQQHFGPNTYVRVQMPLDLGENSEPEPDLAVVIGSPRDYPSHPNTALLVVEVSDTSLLHDRDNKQPLYARAGIQESWVLNLLACQLEVRRDPVGGDYQSFEVFGVQDCVSLLHLPTARIRVSDLLP